MATVMLSIIIPAYNCENNIKKVLYSLSKQTCNMFEVIIVNDGSTDNTENSCKEFIKGDDRFKVITVENGGAGSARNIGIENAVGEYLYFADSDDYPFENLVEELCSIISSNNKPDLVIFSYDNESRKTGEVKQTVFRSCKYEMELVFENFQKFMSKKEGMYIFGAPWNKCFKSSVIKENGLSFPLLRRHQDELFIMKYIDVINEVVFSDTVLYSYTVEDNAFSIKRFPDNYFEIMEELYNTRRVFIERHCKQNSQCYTYISDEYIHNLLIALTIIVNRNRLKFAKNKLDKVRNTDSYNMVRNKMQIRGLSKQNKIVIALFDMHQYTMLWIIKKIVSRCRKSIRTRRG